MSPPKKRGPSFASDETRAKDKSSSARHTIDIPIDVQVFIAVLAPLCFVVLILAAAGARQ